MKCVFLTTEFPPGPGGIGVHTFQVIEQLKKQYHWKFKIILTQLDNSSDKDFEKFKKSYHSEIFLLKKSPSFFKLISNIIKILIFSLKYNPKIIISSGRHAVWFGSVIKLLTRKKLISFCHGSEFGTKNIREQKINNYSYSYADLLISVSKYTLNYIKTQTDIKCNNSIVIHNGANHEIFKKIDNNHTQNFLIKNNLNDKKILLTIGNVSERKGQWVVINAMPEILKKNPNVFYYCIGNPTQKNEFLQLAIKLNVQDRVVFTGSLSNSEIVKWLNISKIFLMTSTHTLTGDFEGFGISVIEAALCGTPAIVTEGNNGVIESIIDNETGYGVPEKSFSVLAEKVNYLLENPDLCEMMGKKSRKRALSKFTWEIKTKEIHQSIITLCE